MLSSYADNHYLSEFLKLINNVYVTQSPAVLSNYYSVSEKSSFSRNNSSYRQNESNIIYDCITLLPTYHSTSTQPRTQSQEQVPQFSSDNIDFSILGIITPRIGDKITISTSLEGLLKHNSISVFDVTQVEMFGTTFDIKSIYKISVTRSTTLNESDLVKYVDQNYVYLSYLNKLCFLEHYYMHVNILKLVDKIVSILESSFSNNYYIINSDTVFIDYQKVLLFLKKYLDIKGTNIDSILRAISSRLVNYLDQNIIYPSTLSFNQVQTNKDINVLRKYPFISKFTNLIEAIVTSSTVSSIHQDVSLLVSQSLIDDIQTIKNVHSNDSVINKYNVFSPIVEKYTSLDLESLSIFDLLFMLSILIKISNEVVCDIPR